MCLCLISVLYNKFIRNVISKLFKYYTNIFHSRIASSILQNVKYYVCNIFKNSTSFKMN